MDKPTKAKKVKDLIHHFVHSVFKNEKLGNYYYNSKILTYTNKHSRNSTIIAIKLNKGKIFIVNNDFDNGGTFGNKVEPWIIKQAIPKYYKIVSVSGEYINDFVKYNTIKSIPKTLLYKAIFSDIEKTIASNYAEYIDLSSEYVRNFRVPYKFLQDYIKYRYSYYDYNSNPDLNVIPEKELKAHLDISKSFLNSVLSDLEGIIDIDKFLKWNPNKTVHYYTYKGWNANIHSLKMDKPLKHYVNFVDDSTDKELDTINFKIWKHKVYRLLQSLDATLPGIYYTHVSNIGRVTYKSLWNNPELKAKFNEVVINKTHNLREQRLKKEKEKQVERLQQQKENLERWLKGNNITVPYDIPVHLRIEKDSVETTKGATIPIKHAEMLYKRFKNCIETNIPWHTNGSSIRVGNFKVDSIDKISDDWYIKAGCHIIYREQIEDFITRNNLNW